MNLVVGLQAMKAGQITEAEFREACRIEGLVLLGAAAWARQETRKRGYPVTARRALGRRAVRS